nr:spore germination protein [Cohnella lupini]
MPNDSISTFDQFIDLCSRSNDFVTANLNINSSCTFIAHYLKTLVDQSHLEQLIHSLQNPHDAHEIKSLDQLKQYNPFEGSFVTNDLDKIESSVFGGFLLIQEEHKSDAFLLIPITGKQGLRTDNDTDVEFSVVGPKIGFIEDIDTNVHLVRMQLRTPRLIVRELTVGTISKTKVVMMYLDGIANPDNVSMMEARIREIEFDIILDTTQLDELITDNHNTPFPLFTTSERRDRVVFALISGQIAVSTDGSPYFITGPSTLFDFFLSPEDYYLPWVLGSFFRVIRITGVVFSLFASALYVALLTHHYEVIPKELLGRLIYSRQNVPFPPVLEALVLEATVEFLREAGARLPSRIGQTLGIVGGVILGQAAVDAALTSNILIIVVSLSALTSFVTPIYKMSNAIRFIRFPMIILAAMWGLFGIAVGLSFLLLHLSRLESLGSPYTVPFFPLRAKDLNDRFIRAPFSLTSNRPGYLRPPFLKRYETPKKQRKKSKIDEEGYV